MENKKRVFVVDDDDDARFMASAVLSQGGYEVSSASSGIEALEIIDQVRPDLIVLDVMMEDCVAGFRVVNRLRDTDWDGYKPGFETTPILMLTSVQQQMKIDFAKHAGTSLLRVDRFMEKPVKPRELLAAVDAMVGQPASN